MPTFLFFRNKTRLDSLRGADAASLEAKILKWYRSGDDEEESVVKGQVSKTLFYYILAVTYTDFAMCTVTVGEEATYLYHGVS